MASSFVLPCAASVAEICDLTTWRICGARMFSNPRKSEQRDKSSKNRRPLLLLSAFPSPGFRTLSVASAKSWWCSQWFVYAATVASSRIFLICSLVYQSEGSSLSTTIELHWRSSSWVFEKCTRLASLLWYFRFFHYPTYLLFLTQFYYTKLPWI